MTIIILCAIGIFLLFRNQEKVINDLIDEIEELEIENAKLKGLFND